MLNKTASRLAVAAVASLVLSTPTVSSGAAPLPEVLPGAPAIEAVTPAAPTSDASTAELADDVTRRLRRMGINLLKTRLEQPYDPINDLC